MNDQKIQRMAMFIAGTLNGYGLAKDWGSWMLLIGVALYVGAGLITSAARAPE